MCQFKIGNEMTGILTVCVKGRCYPQSQDSEDSNWLGADIGINSKTFNGTVACSLRAGDFDSFHKKLCVIYEKLKGKAQFTTAEDVLFIEVEAKTLGHMLVQGYVKDDVNPTLKLCFTFNLDQTDIKYTIQDLQKVVNSLPYIRCRNEF